MESNDLAFSISDDILSSRIMHIMKTMKHVENQMSENSLDNDSRYVLIDFEAELGPNYTLDDMIHWLNANEEKNGLIMRGLYQKAADLSIELNRLQVTDDSFDAYRKGIIDHFVVPRHTSISGMEFCFQSKFSGFVLCSLLEFLVSMEKSVLSSLTLNNVSLRSILDCYGENIVHVSDMEEELNKTLFSKFARPHNSQSSLEAYAVQLFENFFEAPYFPSMMTIEHTSTFQESIEQIQTGSLRSSIEKCVVFKISTTESSLRISSIPELLRFVNYSIKQHLLFLISKFYQNYLFFSSCDRLLISLPILFVINVCRESEQEDLEIDHTGSDKSFFGEAINFSLDISSVCAPQDTKIGNVSQYGR